jgi:hypothetical protein
MSDFAARAVAEVEGLHDVFVPLFTGGATDDLDTIMGRFHPAFVRTGPEGASQTLAELREMLAALVGMVPESFRIAVEIEGAIAAGPGVAVVRYVERQTGRGGEPTARRSLAVFVEDGGAPRWLALQETWIDDGRPKRPDMTPARPANDGGCDE